MKLKDVAIRNAKAKESPYKLTDGGGLYLQVTPSGGKLWRWNTATMENARQWLWESTRTFRCS